MDRSKIFFGVVGFVFLATSVLILGSLNRKELSSRLTTLEDRVCIYSLNRCLPAEPEILFGFNVDSLLVIEDRIRRNQNLATILTKHNVNNDQIYALGQASRGVFDVRKMVANRKITLFCYPDSLQTVKAVVYEPSEIEYIIFNLDDSVHVSKYDREIQTVRKTVTGTIERSLAESMEEMGLPPILTNQVADVFAWEINFFRLYPGDKFKVIYLEEMVNGKSVGIQEIVGAQFRHDGEDFFAVRYDQGNGPDYFDPSGKSLRKDFLPYPVEYSRISSRYSGRRYHPVLKRYKAHLGTDYAAPRGTDIRAVAAGKVVAARFGKYNGNYVKIEHNGIYTTGYLHMTGFAKGIKEGVKVEQGQVIGKVGSTGLANGNHVCFRFWNGGKQVDYLQVDLPPSEPIDEKNLESYNIRRDLVLDALEKLDFPVSLEIGPISDD